MRDGGNAWLYDLDHATETRLADGGMVERDDKLGFLRQLRPAHAVPAARWGLPADEFVRGAIPHKQACKY